MTLTSRILDVLFLNLEKKSAEYHLEIVLGVIKGFEPII